MKTALTHRHFASAASALVCLGFAACAHAQSCNAHPGLTRFATQIAEQHFAALTRNMPQIVECDEGVFPPGVGGDYNGGNHTIRIPRTLRNNPQAKVTIAHELAHALVAISSERHGSPPHGHGQAFYKVLIEAGFGQEAQRVAAHYGNRHELAAAGSSSGNAWGVNAGWSNGNGTGGNGGGGSAAASRVVCRMVPTMVQQMDPRTGCPHWVQVLRQQCEVSP